MDNFGKELTQFALLRDVAAIIPGEFQLLNYVGEGGHGIVFKAFYKPLHTKVALKLIKNDGSADTHKQLERMQNEARTLAKLDHSNIVKVLQFTQCKDGTPLLVCEFIEGRTLSSFLQKNRQMNKDQLTLVFSQLLDALKYSHEHGMIHRDIKPNNIMIVTDPESKAVTVKLLDFGIARDFEESLQTPLGLTRTIQITGSAPYMSPEQCAGQRVDSRSDIYSIGCVLFECLSGRPPFQGETPVHTRYMQIHEKPKMPSLDTDSDLRAKGELYKVALMALDKNPASRIQSAESFKELLLAACSASRFNSTTASTRKQHISFLNGALIGASSVALIVLIFLITWKNLNKQDNSIEPTGASSIRTPVKRALSPLHSLSLVNKQDERMGLLKPDSIEYQRRMIESWDSINECLPRIDKNDHTLLFSAWYLRGGFAKRLKQTREEARSYEEALKHCRTKEGKETIEAAQCLCALAELYVRADKNGVPLNLRKAETYALRALELRKEFEKGSYVMLPANESINCSDQSGGLWQPLKVLVTVAESKGNLEKATTWAAQIAEFRQNQLGLSNAIDEHCALASLLWKAGKGAEATKVIEEQINALIKNKEPVAFEQYTKLFHWLNARDQDLLLRELKKCFDHFQTAEPFGDKTEMEFWTARYKSLEAKSKSISK